MKKYSIFQEILAEQTPTMVVGHVENKKNLPNAEIGTAWKEQ